MKKNLLLALSLWVAGGSTAGAQSYYPPPVYPPYYVQPASTPPGGFPGFKAPAVPRYQGLEPYPTDVVPASAVGSSASLPPIPPIPPSGIPAHFDAPARASTSGTGTSGTGTSGTGTSGTGTSGTGFVPAQMTPPDNGARDIFLPPLPMPADGLPRTLPKAPEADPPVDSPPIEETLPPTDTLPPAIVTPEPVTGVACVAPSPGQPVIDQYVPWHPSAKGERWFFSLDYMRWWAKDQEDVPPLTFTTATGAPGALRKDADNDERSGVRAHLGRWVDPLGKLALEGDFLWLGDRRQGRRISATNLPDTVLPFFAGIAELSRNLEYRTSFWQQEFGLRYKLVARDCWHIDLTAGNRYFELEEGITIATSTRFATQTVIFSDATVTTNDRIDAENQYIGGQVGFEGEYQKGIFFLQAFAKFGVGNIRQRLNLSATTTVVAPPEPLLVQNQVIPGQGAFVGPTNSGSYSRDRLAFVPEAGIFVGVRPHDCVRLALGYNFLYVSDVARPVDQIDRAAGTGSPLAFVGPPFQGATPTPQFNSSSFWLQGVTVRLEIRY